METQERKVYATDFGVEKGLPKEEVVYTGLPSAPQVCLGEPWVTFSPSIIIVSAPYTLIWTINNNGHMTFKKTAQSNLIPHYLYTTLESAPCPVLSFSLSLLCASVTTWIHLQLLSHLLTFVQCSLYLE